MLTVESLREYGANLEEGISRCMGNEEFYLKLVRMALADGNYEKLDKALAAEDWSAAFNSAHALKGVLGNLSLTPAYEPMVRLTDLLRAKTACDYKEVYEEFLKAKNELVRIKDE